MNLSSSRKTKFIILPSKEVLPLPMSSQFKLTIILAILIFFPIAMSTPPVKLGADPTTSAKQRIITYPSNIVRSTSNCINTYITIFTSLFTKLKLVRITNKEHEFFYLNTFISDDDKSLKEACELNALIKREFNKTCTPDERLWELMSNFNKKFLFKPSDNAAFREHDLDVVHEDILNLHTYQFLLLEMIAASNNALISGTNTHGKSQFIECQCKIDETRRRAQNFLNIFLERCPQGSCPEDLFCNETKTLIKTFYSEAKSLIENNKKRKRAESQEPESISKKQMTELVAPL